MLGKVEIHFALPDGAKNELGGINAHLVLQDVVDQVQVVAARDGDIAWLLPWLI